MGVTVQRLLFAILVGGLLVQGGSLLTPAAPARPSGPRVGNALPSFEATTMAGDTVSLAQVIRGAPCTLLVVASTSCVWCQRMRATWSDDVDRWIAEVQAENVAMVWLFREDWFEISDFLNAEPFPKAYPLGMLTPETTWSSLGILGTPTTFLLDRSAALVYGTMGDRLPPIGQGREACR